MDIGHGAGRGLTAVDWDRRGGAADNARILLDYDPAAFEARVRAALPPAEAGRAGFALDGAGPYNARLFRSVPVPP